MGRRSRTIAIGVFSLIAGFVLAELALRVFGYRFSPIVFVRPDSVDDHRPFHMGGLDFVIHADPLTVPDPDLLWRSDPAASRELNAQGFRGPDVHARVPGRRLIMALGDSNTLGPLDGSGHWPGFLDDMLRATEAPTPAEVINAGVYGYTSFQGLRSFRRIARYAPDIVYFSFGANDASPVRSTDVQYAERLGRSGRWARFRLGPPLAHVIWRARDAMRPPPRTFRVPLADYRRNLESFVGEARRAGILPILMTHPFSGTSDDPANLLHHLPAYNEVVREVADETGAPLLDGFAILAQHPDFFMDPVHNDRFGFRLLAEGAFSQLVALGFAKGPSRQRLGSIVDFGTADDRRPELGPGFWPREPWPQTPGGRWTHAQATMELQRAPGDQALLVDLSCFRPSGRTEGVIEVDGRAAIPLPAANGRYRLWVPLGPAGEERVNVRFVVHSAYRPRELDPNNKDPRVVGVFLHEVRVARSRPDERWQRDGFVSP